jgi:hypothetical protein
MKNLIKIALVAFAVTAFASCKGGLRNGATDSVANHPDTNGTSTTVDTFPTTIDTTKADTVK